MELLETERIYSSALTKALEYMPVLMKGDTSEVLKNRSGTIFGNLETVEVYHRV